MHDRMVNFWDSPELDEAKKKIVNPHTWDYETNEHLKLVLEKDPWVQDWLSDKIENLTALDIGCGIGRLMRPASARFKKVCGIDISPEMLKHAATYLAGRDNCSLGLIHDGGKFPIADRVDFVYSVVVFQHLPSIQIIRSYLNQCYQLMNDGGVIRIQTHRGIPNAEGTFHGYAGHMFRQTSHFVDEFERAGFKVVGMQDGAGHPEWLWVSAQKRLSVHVDILEV
jgi:cyclopropane fatty-acyl-phospholipid synthase-like methyltransferase